jgi:hypothetical protein
VLLNKTFVPEPVPPEVLIVLSAVNISALGKVKVLVPETITLPLSEIEVGAEIKVSPDKAPPVPDPIESPKVIVPAPEFNVSAYGVMGVGGVGTKLSIVLLKEMFAPLGLELVVSTEILA